MSKPDITVVIPTFRRPKLLARAIRSMQNQTFPDFKILVLDNASGDETGDVVRELASQDNRIIYHCHKENIGAAKNFRYGLEQVDTAFFSLMSDDDFVLPWFFETARKGFARYGDVAFSGGVTVILFEHGSTPYIAGPQKHFLDGYFSPGRGLLTLLDNYFPLWTGTLNRYGILFRTEAREITGGFADYAGSPVDIDFTYRLALCRPFVLSRRICALHTRGLREQAGATPSLDLLYPSWAMMTDHIAKAPELSPEIRDAVLASLHRAYASQMRATALFYLRQGKLDEANKTIEVIERDISTLSTWYMRAILRLSRTTRIVPSLFGVLWNILRAGKRLFWGNPFVEKIESDVMEAIDKARSL